MAIWGTSYNGGGAGGSGGSSSSSSPLRYIEAGNGTRQLTKNEQFVRIKSDFSNSAVIMPYSTEILDGHFVDLFRGVGSFDQVITSHDSLVGELKETEKTPEAHLHLVGGPKDASPNTYFPVASDNVVFANDDVLGTSHSVMHIDDNGEEFEGVLLDEQLVEAAQLNWTVFGRFKYDGSDLELSSGLFTLGNPTSQGYAISLIFKSTSKVKLWFGKTESGSEMSLTFNSLGSTLLDGNWHTIAITNESNGLSGLEIYVDDMNTPIASSTINGGFGVEIRGDGFSVGHARHTDASSAPVKGYYSNWQVYKETLNSDDLIALRDNAVIEASDLSKMGIDESLRAVYNQLNNSWKLLNLNSLETKARAKAISNVSQAIPVSNTGNVVDFEVEEIASGINLSGGEIEFLESGLYNFEVDLNLNMKDVAASGEVEAWIERRDSGSASWQAVENSGRHKEFIAVTLTDPDTSLDISFKTDGNFSFFDKAMQINKGDELRVKIRGDVANLTLMSETLVNGTKSPSAIISIAKV